MRRPLMGAAVIALSSAALVGCTSSHSSPQPASSSPVAASTAAATPSGTLPADNDTVQPAPTAGTTSQASAVDVAVKLMTAYARPDRTADAWLAGLDPYLTQTGAAAYEGTDPAQVPVSKVTGSGTVMAAATVYALNVSVPTNKGVYVVALTRTSTTAPWLADRIIVPGD
jgi:hypothetical protein